MRINNRIGMTALLLSAGTLLNSCYDQFDPNSYKPEFTIGGFTAVDEIEPASLVAYFPFDGSLAETKSGGSAVNGGGTFINGFKGGAFQVKVADKSFATFDAPASITSMESFTISFWVNPEFVDADANGSIDGILGFVGLSNQDRFWGNIEWFVENNSNNDGAILKVILTNDNSQETDILVSGYKGLFGVWTNHTLTFDAATSKLTYYINGSTAQTKTTPWTGPIALVNSGPMVFGAVQFMTTPSLTSSHGSEGWASSLTGALDEVRVYSKALSAEDVNAMVVLQGKGK